LNAAPRVAFFADSFHEVNGVANTSRQLEAYAQRQGYPFFSVHAGPENAIVSLGSVTRFEMRRGAAQLQLERDLSFDLWLWRRHTGMTDALREFRPDVIHITGPSDIGIVGMIVAKRLQLPLVASWHTNLHDYAGNRLQHLLPFLPQTVREGVGNLAESFSLAAVMKFYKAADALMAPNQELIDLVSQHTGKSCALMQRGVDTILFSPEKRNRTDARFTVGYVGRLSTEKNVRLLARVGQALHAANIDFRILVVGHGSETDWLRAHVPNIELPGVLKGAELAQAYANMDVFTFPSTTDTFGNVILEALASGTPAVVTTGGGPKFLVQHGETGLIAATDDDFVAAVRSIAENPTTLITMRDLCRAAAKKMSWDSVFGRVYDVYRQAQEQHRSRTPMPVPAKL
jgi:phosphatidylinositol alpha 1,6-mannosyltransferase